MKKNPGKKFKEEKKAQRGNTWVGKRPSIVPDKKKETKKKQARKRVEY